MDSKMMEDCAKMMQMMKAGDGGKMSGDMTGQGGMGMMGSGGMMGQGGMGMMGSGGMMGQGGMGTMGSGGMMGSGRSLLQRLFASPLALLGLGAAAGILAYKYRKDIVDTVEPAKKEIVKTVMKAADAGKDFVLEQKEKLSDIVAAIKEEEEGKAKKGRGAVEE